MSVKRVSGAISAHSAAPLSSLFVVVRARSGGSGFLVGGLLGERAFRVFRRAAGAVGGPVLARQEGVEVGIVLGRLLARGSGQQRGSQLGRLVGSRRPIALVQERVELLATCQRLERLAGQRFERSTAGPLALGCPIGRRAGPTREQLADDLDVLVVDRDALAPIVLLDFLDQVALDRVLAPGLEVFLGVDRAVRDRIAGTDLLAVLHLELGVVRDAVLALDDVLRTDDEAVAGPDGGSLTRRGRRGGTLAFAPR